jgi:predicted RNA polymerase sigma factor
VRVVTKPLIVHNEGHASRKGLIIEAPIVDGLGAPLDRYHLFHAARAMLLRALGRTGEAREADLRAIALTANPAERALLQERIGLH